LNVVIASVSGIGGVLSGAINTRGTIRGIEKKGEYHPSRNRLVLLLGVGLVVGAVLVYVIESGAISFSILSQFMSMYAGIPAIYLGGAVTFRRWELKNGKEIQWEGAWGELSTPSPEILRGRRDLSTGTSNESDRGSET
jgi:hypothetical protein